MRGCLNPDNCCMDDDSALIQQLRDQNYQLQCALEAAHQRITWLTLGHCDPAGSYVNQDDRDNNARRCSYFSAAPGELVLRWSNTNALPKEFNRIEAEAAILDALVTQGIKAWSGDASSCVTNIIEAVWRRNQKELK